MTPYATICASEPIRFAPFSALIGNLMTAVPRYVADYSAPGHQSPITTRRTEASIDKRRQIHALLRRSEKMTTAEVRDAMGMPNTSACDHLNALAADGSAIKTRSGHGYSWEAA